ncbi:MAG: PASTA domain-containing protein [Methanosarcina sp.]|uniref:PASTA domain-containing protein n=1 Tax=Methanosarcina sp. TaxID=2213 RepID=UPI002609875D|nr:PASTA domain-containing protein [Methanosarcina sp.]MDD3246375.1 PASTA domain-containing protein [Methanosarcina sp.]MDD4247845.1 PASTA domain-containing protein [Methanosarcina sp.]
MKAQLEQRLVELRAEYESGQKILKDIEIKLVELENRKKNLNETLLRISGAVELLEEVLGEESKSSTPKVLGPEVPETETPGSESEKKEVEVPLVIRFPLEQAVKKLEEAGLRAGNIGEKSLFVAGVRFGDVIQQEPKGGMLVERGSSVDLIVGKKGNFKPDLSQNALLCPYSRH